jgi:pimeloyl-ACP methyl ester carboxylesterase
MSVGTAYQRFLEAHPPRVVRAGGHDWRLIEAGPVDAPPVLLLPGALGRPETAFEYVAALAPAFRVLSAGYPTTARTMTDLADGVAALLCETGAGRAHVVGGSFGGLVAQALLARHPERVARLVLSDTSPPTPARALRMRASAALIRALPAGAVRAVLAFGVGRYVAAMPADSRAFWRAHFAETLAGLTQPEVEARARAWAEFDAGCRAPFAERETLILCAASDHAVSPAALRRRFPHAAVHVVASPLGHAASVGDAAAYTGPIRRFLEAGR